MAGLNSGAKVTRLFKTAIFLTNEQIVAWLSVKGVKLIPHGPGGFPTGDVFHTPYDEGCVWRGSRLEGNEGLILAFYTESDDDPIFTALLDFSKEIIGEKKDAIITAATAASSQPKTA